MKPLVQNSKPGKKSHFKGNPDIQNSLHYFLPFIYIIEILLGIVSRHGQVIQVLPISTGLNPKMIQLKLATECLGQIGETCYNSASLTVIRQILATKSSQTKKKKNVSEATPKAGFCAKYFPCF